MKKATKQIFYAITLFFASLPVGTSAATTGANGLPGLIQNSYQEVANSAGLRTGATTDKITPLEIFGLYLNILVGFIGVLFIVQVVHGGILWMTAGGNEEQVEHARKKMISATIGAAVMFGSYILTYFILSQIASTTDIVGF
ncbi:hypothetical protein COV04_02125 [Candidatus Uhrbacteria bacterium CG10_big_fil_rev_8_21_14_0_10_48_11]|uniref:Uncharacterized protein n=1 Tax=Candidatus Uhrbacteria bacterium CG10_big_fil_rev_8_21_14_0_10_48_11 TaxID=1975037 RepID=A0A2M8LEQ3_9BACT|nr:MAG: hypothetical protein COV04_02125 [Candidatus Uhrbacteria bacterium CG10_big_fil_rev_8_21_14_0_10_48_11]